MLIWALWLGCGGADPELAARARALAKWEAGEQAMLAADPVAAAASFEAALVERPGDPVLLAWRARALAEAGELDAAVVVYEQALSVAPRFGEARYGLASVHARAGRVAQAAAELQQALQDGAASPREVLTDTDFVPMLGDPAFGFLPKQQLVLSLSLPDGPVFVGSDLSISLAVRGAGDAPVVLSGSSSGPLTLVEVREAHEGEDVQLTYRLRVLGGGEVNFGPWDVSAGGADATVPAQALQTLAPEGAAVVEAVPWSIASARTVAHGLKLGQARWEHEELRVLTGRVERVVVSPTPARPATRYVYSEGGQERWVVHAWPLAERPANVQIWEGGELRWEGVP